MVKTSDQAISELSSINPIQELRDLAKQVDVSTGNLGG
jgi:hypothetical protein